MLEPDVFYPILSYHINPIDPPPDPHLKTLYEAWKALWYEDDFIKIMTQLFAENEQTRYLKSRLKLSFLDMTYKETNIHCLRPLKM